MILSSEYTPCEIGLDTFQVKWEESFVKSDYVDLLVGYVSNESLNYLDQLADIYDRTRIRLMVGMAMFDGISSSQKRQLFALNQKLEDQNRGGVFVSQQFPFHGKVHIFGSSSTGECALIGSSNLSNIVPQTGFERGNFELDVLVDNQSDLATLEQLASLLFSDAGSPLSECYEAIPVLKTRASALRNHAGASAVEDAILMDLKSKLTPTSFDLPIKTEPKSSLNVYFGKGRKQGKFVRPRSWYEAALIVGKRVIESAPGYPAGQSFIVYTDDGFRFGMRTGGGNNKNLESLKDLTTFGRWIKGRLEDADALQTGTLVTPSTLNAYGRNNLRLTKTNFQELYRDTNQLLDVWFMDFSRPIGGKND